MIDSDIEYDESSIPNGIIIRHPSGSPAFITLDEKGKIYGEVCELSMTDDWVKTALPDNVVIFVHAITGAESLITKRLFMIRLEIEAKEKTVWFLLTTNRLQSVLDDLWNRFMDGKLDGMVKALVQTETKG